MGEEFVPVFQQAVGAAIERVVLREAFVRAQQAGAGRGGKRAAVQTPFAAGGKQPVKREQAQDFLPVRAFAAATQARGEEGVELEIAPEPEIRGLIRFTAGGRATKISHSFNYGSEDKDD